MGVKRFGVAFVATASIVLASALPARAQEAPPPARASGRDDEHRGREHRRPTPLRRHRRPPSRRSRSTPAPDATPSTDTAKTDTSSAESTPAPDAKSAEPATTEPAKTKPAEASPRRRRPLRRTPSSSSRRPQPAAARVAAARRSACAASRPDAQAPSAASTQVTIVLVAETPPPPILQRPPRATPAEAAETAAAMIVSFRPRRAPSAISLLPTVERDGHRPRARPRAERSPRRHRSARPVRGPPARVPLSADCEQARAISALRVRLTYLPGSEVRAAIVRGPSRISIRRVEARPPPESKAAKKHPVAEVRPTVPFGSSGQGAANHSFNRSTGATWSSRVLVLAAPPLRVPRPSRFVRLRLPSTIPHGVIAAPPPARPG